MTKSELSVRWMRIDSSGDRKQTSPFTGERNRTPSSLILRNSPRLNTWNPPESVRIGLSQAMKRCKPPCAAMTSSPGLSHRWKVLPSTICAPTACRSSGLMALTVPYVPTGMKTGGSMLPWAKVKRPRRASPSLDRISNFMSGGRALVRAGAIDQHGVAVAEKPVFVVDCVLVCMPYMLDTRKGADQHQQCGARQMKIGQQAVHQFEPVSWPDEQARFAVSGFQVARLCRRFQRAQTGRADRSNAAAAHMRIRNCPDCGIRNRIALAMHGMGVYLVHPHRLKGARADMQSDISQRSAAGLETVQHRLVEMQPRGRSGDCTRMTRIDSLVPRQILDAGRSLDIRR